MKKTYLFTPGPTAVPPETLLAMAQPTPHHRTEAFSAIFKEARELLRWSFQTTGEVLILASSGTGAMEASLVNTLSPGDKIISVSGGKFGQRWAKIAKPYGLNCIEIPVENGKAVDPAVVEATLAAHPDAKALCWQACETSTGVQNPTEKLVQIAKAHNALSIVDAITGLMAFDLPMDKWGIDILLGGSQKAYMLPPGLAFISLSERAWAATKSSKLPKFYFDLSRELKNAADNTTAWTPAVSLIMGLVHNLREAQKEGLPTIFARHDELARAVRAAGIAMGCELFAPEAPSPSITAIKFPAGVDGKKFKKILDGRGIHIAGGQDELNGKIFRIGHMGYYDRSDMIMALSACEQVLAELGHPVELGSAAKATMQVFLGRA